MKRSSLLLSSSALAALMAFTSPAVAFTPAKTSQKVAEAAPTFSSSNIYYYNGPSRVDLVVALDEVFVAPAAGAAVRKQADWKKSLKADVAAVYGKAAQIDEVETGLFVRMNTSGMKAVAQHAADLQQLNPGWEAQAVAYTSRAAASTDRGGVDAKQALPRRFSLGFQETDRIGEIEKAYNVRVVEKVPFSPNTYIVEALDTDPLAGLQAANAIVERETGIAFATPLVARQHVKRLIPNDPLFGEQWHLKNTGEQVPDAVAGADILAEKAWDIATGVGVNISIVDDGLEVAHEDLAANVRTDLDIDLTSNDQDPSPAASNNEHGTACAGIAAAVGNNGTGVAGVAFGAKLIGVRLVDVLTSDQTDATGLSHRTADATPANRAMVVSSSWGPTDDGANLTTWGPLTKAAVENAIANGRGGLGTIYTWAAGNGRCNADDVNYDGYASSRYTIAVGATGADGKFSYYSEPGASMLVNAPSNYGTCAAGSVAGTTTVDQTGANGYSGTNYTDAFGGTSSACPTAAGVVALMLQANPNLTWRDVQHVLLESATKNDPSHSGWFTNGAGKEFNHAYGFGRLNALRAVLTAQSWTNAPAAATPLVATNNTSLSIPDGTDTFVSRTLPVSAPADFYTEHVELTLNINHTYRGDLTIELVSPSGTVSTLAELRDDGNDNYSNWTFTTVAAWGENPNGTWSVRLKDGVTQDSGTLTAATLRVYGFVKGSWTATLPVNTAPSQPQNPEPVMYVQLPEPSVDPQGDSVSYIYTWTSSGGDAPVVLGPRPGTEAALAEGDGGATFDAGELWTVSVEAQDDRGAKSPATTKGQFRIEGDGTITFMGWITR